MGLAAAASCTAFILAVNGLVYRIQTSCKPDGDPAALVSILWSAFKKNQRASAVVEETFVTRYRTELWGRANIWIGYENAVVALCICEMCQTGGDDLPGVEALTRRIGEVVVNGQSVRRWRDAKGNTQLTAFGPRWWRRCGGWWHG